MDKFGGIQEPAPYSPTGVLTSLSSESKQRVFDSPLESDELDLTGHPGSRFSTFKGGRAGSPLFCASASLTFPSKLYFLVVHVKSASALLNCETLCTSLEIYVPKVCEALSLK